MAEDELDELVTECPNCSTRFRVNESQLEIASGRVRCGACLTVFDGAEHLLLGSDEPPAEESDADLDQLLDELSESVEDDADRSADVDDLGDEFDSEDGPDASEDGPDVSEDGPDVSEDGPDVSEDGPDVSEDERDVSEDAADEPIEDEPADAESTGEPAEIGGTDAQAQEPKEPEEQGRLDDGQSPDVGDEEPEAWDDEIWGAFGEDASEPGQTVDAGTNQDDVAEAEPAMEASAQGSIGQEVVVAGLPENEIWAIQEESDDDEQSLPYLGDLDVETKSSRRWWVRLILVVAVLGLVAQVLWYQSDNWSRDPDMRPYYETICEWLDCELPVISAPEQIRSQNLVVRSHPEVRGALIVDALVVNNAPHPQPFPVVELTFTTIDGNLVAGRRFKPDEYLAGELDGATLLPSLTPVHITLEIEDPGAEAVNYRISFR